MGLDIEHRKADQHEICQQAKANKCAISRGSGLVVIELSANDLLIGSNRRVETIKVVGFGESLAVRLQRARKATN